MSISRITQFLLGGIEMSGPQNVTAGRLTAGCYGCALHSYFRAEIAQCPVIGLFAVRGE
ncbi:hypothetical protein [Brachybacterium fresconis]|uniref:Uncharacterized protein n=1 Tax=Brachybacterium fresconis TaxID=173363 RepID=A0ABS4YF52_9MICO|nr:hypothetical protein [Brachybacterium fresconis]MBP2407417.1 hypothetical protein [Brachybacterium fresconis]